MGFVFYILILPLKSVEEFAENISSSADVTPLSVQGL
jgi:hypothetical protein